MRLARILLFVFLGLLGSLSAHAQSRLELVENVGHNVSGGGALFHRWSLDGGATWSARTALPKFIKPGCDYWSLFPEIGFKDAPAIISDQPGRLWVVALDQHSSLVYNVQLHGQWLGWCRVPGQVLWSWTGRPALASWGPGRIDLFANKWFGNDGGQQVKHFWANNGIWSGNDEEFLGSGIFVGSPAAVSWGPGRIDLFVGGPGRSLSHKAFSNGHWSSSWDQPGGYMYMSSSPVVTSSGSGRLQVFIRNEGGQLASLAHANNLWGIWINQGGNLASNDTYQFAAETSLSAASAGAGTVDVLVRDTNLSGQLNKLDFYGFRPIGPVPTTFAITYWTPYTPPPPGGDGGGGGDPCLNVRGRPTC
jgi:hypothetical protein